MGLARGGGMSTKKKRWTFPTCFVRIRIRSLVRIRMKCDERRIMGADIRLAIPRDHGEIRWMRQI